MRVILSALLSLVLSLTFSANAFANVFGGGIPKEVPYTYEGVTYDRYLVFSRTSYDICSNTHAVYFVSSEMEAAGHPSGSLYSLIRYDNRPVFITGPEGAHTAIFSAADNFQGTCIWPTDSVPETTTGTQAWDLRTDQPEAIHDHNFDLYTRSWFGANSPYPLPYTFTDQYNEWGTWYEGEYQGDSSFGFPIPKNQNGNSLTPYTAKVSAIIDYSITTPYVEDGTVRAFNGTEVKAENGRFDGCYRKENGSDFSELGINYVGTSGTGGKYYLCYDGHPGYDYPYPRGTPIHAATAGTLCVATNKTAYDGSLWREPGHCPFSKAGGTNWNDYHTFYIIHEGLIFNGSVDSYMTVYLHNDSLEPSIEEAVRNNGYVMVTDGQYVANVGKYGTNGNHMHFETYKWKASTSKWIRVDPYGDGVNNILWRH